MNFGDWQNFKLAKASNTIQVRVMLIQNKTIELNGVVAVWKEDWS